MSNDTEPEAKLVDFRGTAGEWFGIWIVNLLLSIITFGIYSAWAKVRTKKYFYNNTFIEGRNFDYHATGMQILIGRSIIVAGYVVFNLLLASVPVLGIGVLIAFLIALPWLVMRSIRFNARMSSFSNVRFDFSGGPGRAFVVFLLFPALAYLLVIGLALGAAYLGAEHGSVVGAAVLSGAAVLVSLIAFPVIDRALKTYSISHHQLGMSGFAMSAPLWPFIRAGLAATGWVVLVGVGGLLLTGFGLQVFSTVWTSPGQFLGVISVLYLVLFVAFFPAVFIYQALTRNVVYGSTGLKGGHRFVSDVTAPRLLWLALSNLVVVVLTLGLMLPWAQIRMATYLAAHTAVIPGGSMDDFIGAIRPEGSAMGDAYTDMEGVDIGLPI